MRLLGAVAVVALAALGGCRRRAALPDAGPLPDPPPLLGEVEVEDLTPEGAVPEAAKIGSEALAADLRRRLRAAAVFAGAPDGGVSGARARVRVRIAIEEVRAEGKAAARAALRFRVETRPEGAAQAHWNEDVEVGSETIFALSPEPDRKAIFSRLAGRTVADVADAYLARQKLWRAPPADLRRALSADGGELRIEAMRAVAERRLKSEVPVLLKLLADQEEAVRDAALGALLELREQSAVREIARQRSMRDRREMRKIVDAISTLGGNEAADYLTFVAEAHDDEEIRQMATRALERLKRRSD